MSGVNVRSPIGYAAIVTIDGILRGMNRDAQRQRVVCRELLLTKFFNHPLGMSFKLRTRTTKNNLHYYSFPGIT